MSTYYFYRINDPKKEILGLTKAPSKEEAICIFSKLKKLDIIEFNKLFEIGKKRRK